MSNVKSVLMCIYCNNIKLSGLETWSSLFKTTLVKAKNKLKNSGQVHEK